MNEAQARELLDAAGQQLTPSPLNPAHLIDRSRRRQRARAVAAAGAIAAVVAISVAGVTLPQSDGRDDPLAPAPSTHPAEQPQEPVRKELTMSKKQLVGPRWTPQAGGPYGTTDAFLQFHSDGTYTGSDGCNGQLGRYWLTRGGHVHATLGPQTRIGCASVPVGSLLARADRLVRQGPLLVLIAQNGETLLRLRATPDPHVDPGISPPSGPHGQLIPADSRTPAAGICAMPTGPFAIVEVNPDAAAPRCQFVRPGQRLRVVNTSDRFGQPGTPVTVTFAEFAPRVLQIGESTTFARRFGNYLATGVHSVRISPYSGADIWLR